MISFNSFPDLAIFTAFTTLAAVPNKSFCPHQPAIDVPYCGNFPSTTEPTSLLSQEKECKLACVFKKASLLAYSEPNFK